LNKFEGDRPVAKKVWRKPEVKSIVAGAAEKIVGSADSAASMS
jgi:hypothetical protein